MSGIIKHILKYYIRYLFSFFLIIGLFVIIKSNGARLGFKIPQATSCNTGWYYYDREGNEHYITSLPTVIPSSSNSKTTRIYHFYSGEYPQELCFYSHHQTVIFSLNGKVIYEYNIEKNPSWLEDYRSFYHIVELPPVHNGEMCLSFTPVGDKYIGEYASIYIGSYQEILVRIFLERIDKLLLGIMLLIIGIICFFLSKMYKRNFSEDKTLLHLCFISFLFGMWILEDSKFLQFIIHNQGIHWCLEYLNQHFILLSAILFMRDVTVSSKKKLSNFFVISSILVSIIVITLQLAGIVQLYNSMYILQMFSVAFCVYIMYLVNVGSFFRSKQRQKLFNFFMILSVIVFFIIIIGRLNRSYGSIALNFGIIFMFISFMFIANQKTIDKYEAVQQAMLYQKLAFVDFNTGVASKTAWFSLIEKFNPEKDKMINCCLLLFDMNNLKKLNDTKGHLFGDKVISTFCECLTKAFIEDGTVFRIGGDEFICFCRHSSEEDVEFRLKKFKELEAGYNGTELEFSCAYGYVFFTPTSKDDFTEAQQRADSLMYDMKRKMKIGREFG
ncbi:MAG: GGDEF domain-containing protein [Treponema sp.]|nr:GGDEF domain-containing protein [Treponema sp.]